MSVCPRVVSLQKIRPESYRWCRIMWLRKHWWFNGLVLFGYASPFSKVPCTHHRVANSKLFCATTDPAGSLFFLQSGGGFILFAALTALLSYENTRVWGQRDSQGDFFFFFFGDEDAPESLSYVPPGRFLSQFFKSRGWSCLVHLTLDAWPYRFSRMGLSLQRGLGCSADSGTDTSHRDFIFCYAAAEMC